MIDFFWIVRIEFLLENHFLYWLEWVHEMKEDVVNQNEKMTRSTILLWVKKKDFYSFI